jgi:hypothetical protein
VDVLASRTPEIPTRAVSGRAAATEEIHNQEKSPTSANVIPFIFKFSREPLRFSGIMA